MQVDRLYLDAGNSSIKGAYQTRNGWELLHPGGAKDAAELVIWLQSAPQKFDEIILASVRKDVSQAIHETLRKYPITELSIADVDSFNLDYETPQTLGIDRYLGCLGASLHAQKGVVVIDAGSACTIDYMHEDGVYHGGVIMPGLDALLNIFRTKAPELPKIPVEIPHQWPAKSTKESLQWGQVGLLVDGINAALQRHRAQFGDFDLYITGGDASHLKDMIHEECIHRPFLVFEGMAELISRKEV